MRKRIFEIIEKSDGNDPFSLIYDWTMIVVIVLSLIPLAFKRNLRIFNIIDHVSACIFFLDYILRWITADFKITGKYPFIRYPFTGMAIIDLLSILPSLKIVNSGFRVLRVVRMIKAMRVVRIFKVLRYSRNIEIIGNVLQKSKSSLMAVCTLAFGYIMVSALVIFNVEPDSFETFFDAVYWATVSLTTVGYGDIYPVSVSGRLIAMFSSLFGIAIVALPAGIITAGYMREIQNGKEEKNDVKDN